jgi:hypothetical protein
MGQGDIRESSLDAKIKISKEDLANTLYCWLAEHLTEIKVIGTAEEIGFMRKGLWGMRVKKSLYEKFYRELFILYMYLIVLTCRDAIEDEEKKNDIVEILHKIVFEKNIRVTGVKYNQWISFMHHIYNRYKDAIESGSLLTPLLLIAEEFEKNLFHKKRFGPYTKFEFSMRIAGMVKHLSGVFQEYTIE